MKASGFDEENCVLDGPPGTTSEDCEPLSVWRGRTNKGNPVVISCWKPTKQELEEINKTGRVWLMVWGETMPPVALLGNYPWEREHE